MRRVSILSLVALASLVCCGAEDKADGEKPAPPVGTWERTVDGQTLTLTVKEGRLRLTLTAEKGSKVLWLMDADYGITKDNLLFGIVTSLEKAKGAGSPGMPGGGMEPGSGVPPPGLPGPGGYPGGSPMPPGGMPGGAPGIPGVGGYPGSSAGRLGLDLEIDDLFRFRFRVDDGVLTVKDTRARGGSSNLDALLPGRYKQSAAKAPGKGEGEGSPDPGSPLNPVGQRPARRAGTGG
jgi:hypothetical protein